MYSLVTIWNGTDITNKPTLIYHDEVQTVMYSSPPRLSNPNGPGGLLCYSAVSTEWGHFNSNSRGILL